MVDGVRGFLKLFYYCQEGKDITAIILRFVPHVVKPGFCKSPEMAFVIQSPFGGEITPEEIRARIGEADAVYIRVDQNKAYWVKGDENGSIDLW